jgi:hypothetical protein
MKHSVAKIVSVLRCSRVYDLRAISCAITFSSSVALPLFRDVTEEEWVATLVRLDSMGLLKRDLFSTICILSQYCMQNEVVPYTLSNYDTVNTAVLRPPIKRQICVTDGKPQHSSDRHAILSTVSCEKYSLSKQCLSILRLHICIC